MDIENLKVRVYFLAGQLEEAKKMFNDAVKEIDEINKTKPKPETGDATPPSN